jgi:hypothetical protein
MLNYFPNMELIIVGTGIVTALIIVLVGYIVYRRFRTLSLRKRFGPEYDLAVLSHGSSSRAEAKLAAREARVKTLNLRDLGATERKRFIADWITLQARFVDSPKAAVTEAEGLISSLFAALGYPKGNFAQRAADISVGYPLLMEDYRRANSIALRPSQIETSAEELRRAMIQFRTIFDELIHTQKPREETNAV